MHDSGFDRQRTRRYHALLLAAMKPPGERVLLVNTSGKSFEMA